MYLCCVCVEPFGFKVKLIVGPQISLNIDEKLLSIGRLLVCVTFLNDLVSYWVIDTLKKIL